MYRTAVSIFVSFVLLSCKPANHQNQEEMHFSFACLSVYSNYSMLYRGGDTVYFQNREESPFKTSFVRLTDSLAFQFRQQINSISWKDMDTVYMKDGKRDGVCFKITLNSDTLQRSVLAFGRGEPKQLRTFIDWIDNLADKNMNRQFVAAIVNFGDTTGMERPGLPPPPSMEKRR